VLSAEDSENGFAPWSSTLSSQHCACTSLGFTEGAASLLVRSRLFHG